MRGLSSLDPRSFPLGLEGNGSDEAASAWSLKRRTYIAQVYVPPSLFEASSRPPLRRVDVFLEFLIP
jgi:hypothetical protein